MGFDPMIQVIHFDDVARAVVMALRPGARGIFNLAGPEPVPLSRVLKMLGRPRLPIPHGAARSMLSEVNIADTAAHAARRDGSIFSTFSP